MTIAKAYGLSLKSLTIGEVDYISGTAKCALCSSSYTPNQDTHQFYSDLTNEVSGAGYTTGGVTLTSKTNAYNTSTNTVALDAADPTWATITIAEIRFAVFYIDTGTPSTSSLLSYMDFEANYAPSAQSFTVTLPAAGLYTLTAS